MLPKLVRDKIPNIIAVDGKNPVVRIASQDEFSNMILQKMSEELLEFHENPSVEEAADMYEVFLAILSNWNFELSEVIKAAVLKKENRGSFEKGVVLESISGTDN